MDQDSGQPTAAPGSQPSAFQPVAPTEGQQPKHRSYRWLVIAASLLVIALAGIATYWALHRSQPKPSTTTTSSTAATSTSPTVDTSTNTTPTTYISNGKDLNLSFVYPANWQVSPPSSNNANDQTITATSPRTSMADTNDQSVVARAVVTIRPKGSDLTELDSGVATLAQNSVQIAYANPTKVQHGYPYITFIHLAGGNPNGLFEEVMITGANKFTKNQTISPYSLLQLDPVVSVTFYQCLTQTCTGDGAKPLSVTNEIWQSSDLGQQVLSLFQSLQIH